MIDVSFLKPNYPFEKRVAILPNHICEHMPADSFNLVIESGFGSYLGISDDEYKSVGCQIASRSEVLASKYIFSLKLIQPSDYPCLTKDSCIIGWIHPLGSGQDFWKGIASDLNLTLVDLDSVRPRVYLPDHRCRNINGLPRHFFWMNSYIAGLASVNDALTRLYLDSPPSSMKACVLGSGSVAQGAFCSLASMGMVPRMFTRNTMDIFKLCIQDYDIICNGIEVDTDDLHIIARQDLERTKESVLIIDAAADAGRAVEGSYYNDIEKPFGWISRRQFYMVNNAPSLMHNMASEYISSVLSRIVFKPSFFREIMG